MIRTQTQGTQPLSRFPTDRIEPSIAMHLKQHQPEPRHRLIGTITSQLDADYGRVRATVDELLRVGLLYHVRGQGVCMTYVR